MIKFILLYYLIGIGIYLSICVLYNKWGMERNPHILVSIFWPIVFILAFDDLIGWLVKEKKDE